MTNVLATALALSVGADDDEAEPGDSLDGIEDETADDGGETTAADE